MPFPTLEAAALSGATVRQLNYWRTPRRDQDPLLVPEYREGRTYLYSFRDLVALRTFVYLRGTLSLQKIRRAVHLIENLGDQEHLSGYLLYATGDTIVWIQPMHETGEWRYTDLVSLPGQEAIPVIMEQVLGPFKTETGKKVLALRSPLPRISVDPEVLGGFPVVAGTRVPYDLVSGLIRDGVPPREVRTFYPSVDAAGARAAERFASYVDRYRPKRPA
jgi:uncharacterized protein (DUF433 family)/DNA-binding transcriptional MerR regulator